MLEKNTMIHRRPKSRYFFRFAPSVLALLGLLAPVVAVAATPAELGEDDRARLRDLYARGEASFDVGAYQAAVKAFQEAYEVSKDPVLLYNMALCYDRMDAYDDAVSMLERYSEFAPASERDDIRRRQDSLRIRKERAVRAAADEPDPRSGVVQEKEPHASAPARLADKPVGEPPRVFSPAAWALSSVAVLGFGTALGTGIASTRVGDRAECANSMGSVVCTDGGARDAQKSRTLAAVADVGIAVGAIATVAVIAIVASGVAKRKRMMAATPYPLVGQGMGGAGMSLRF